jgi:hypothetical protein
MELRSSRGDARFILVAQAQRRAAGIPSCRCVHRSIAMPIALSWSFSDCARGCEVAVFENACLRFCSPSPLMHCFTHFQLPLGSPELLYEVAEDGIESYSLVGMYEGSLSVGHCRSVIVGRSLSVGRSRSVGRLGNGFVEAEPGGWTCSCIATTSWESSIVREMSSMKKVPDRLCTLSVSLTLMQAGFADDANEMSILP